jgi:hypothetical protein
MVDSLREVIGSIEQLVITFLEELPQDVQEEIATHLKEGLEEISSDLQKEGKDWNTLLDGEEGNQLIDAIRAALTQQEPAKAIPDSGAIPEDSPSPQREHKGFRLFRNRER